MSLFEGKKVIIIGDRDGIPGPAIEKCIEGTGAEVVFFIHRMLCLNCRRSNGFGKSKKSKNINRKTWC